MARKRQPVQNPPPASSSEEEEEEEKIPLKKRKAGAGKGESRSRRKKPSSSSSDGVAGVVKAPVTAKRWSEADEIVILKGMIEFNFKEQPDGFHDFIKSRFEPEMSRSQVNEKIRRLKNKYETNAGKAQNGNDPVLSNPHDRECFQLSKQIWGKETDESNITQEKKSKDVSSEDEDNTEDKEASTEISSGSEEESEDVEFWKDYPCMKECFETEFSERLKHMGCSMMDFLERKAGFIGGEKLKEMERKWKQVRIDELELFVRRVELVEEIARAELDALKARD